MEKVTALFGFRWIAVVTLLFSPNGEEYDLPDLCIGPFRSLKDLKSWKRKFAKCLGRRCGQLSNIIAYGIDFKEEGVYIPGYDNLTNPRNPPTFVRDFLSDALRGWMDANSRRAPKIKTHISQMQK